jgi:biotin carboxylase
MRSNRPVLAIAFGEGSASALKLAEPARELCDLVWVIDSSTVGDSKTMTRLLRKLGTTIDIAGLTPEAAADAVREAAPDGVVAYADAQMTMASNLAVRLGLDYHDRDTAERLIDKLTQRQALSDGGLPVPCCVDVPPSPSCEDIEALAAGVEFPVVLKPRHGAASRDTVLVGDGDELARVLTKLAADGADSEMVIEEYMVGASPPPSADFADYLSIESIVVKGVINHVAVTGRMYQVEPFRETGLIIPSDFDSSVTVAALDLATKALSAVGVETGCFHTEIKVTTNGLRVIEVNGRLGGFVPEVMALAAPGVDLYEISQRVALGEHIEFPEIAPTDGVGYVIVEQPPISAQRVEAVDGLDRLAEYPGVSSVFLSRQPGDAVDWRKGSHEYVWSVLGNAPDHDGVLALQRFIAEEVVVTYS